MPVALRFVNGTRKLEVGLLPWFCPFYILPQVPVSPTILASPILLFTGAGASAPLDKLLMDSFVTQLSDKVREQKYSTMLRLLKEFRGNDLEAIMGELDILIGLNYASEVSGSRPNSGGGYNGFAFAPDTAKHLHSFIKHEIIREYREVDADKTVKLYEPLFDVIFSKLDLSKHCLVIFTTNYDPAIEIFCQQKYHEYNLCDGFAYNEADRHNYWHRSVFDGFQLVPNKRNIVLFKMHGSVDWMHIKSLDKIRRAHAMYDSMDSDAFSNVLIYPATRKIATEEPYYWGYEYFQRCCETAKLCLAIGYSFRDYDALTRLRGSSSVNDKLKVALASPSAKTIVANMPLPEKQKIPVETSFGEPACIQSIEALLP